MKIIIQARVGSTRLPGKILQVIAGKPLLAWMLERLSGYPVLVATTNEEQSDLITAIAGSYGVPYVQGSVDDVLGRFLLALKDSPADEVVVRLTSDCPLVDPLVVDKMVDSFLEKGLDYLRTGLSYPEGMDVEVCRKRHLMEADRNSIYPSEREHVTLYIQSNGDKFCLGMDELEEDCSSYRITVDEAVDLDVVSFVIKKAILNGGLKKLTFREIIMILDENPEVKTLNSHVIQNEGLLISLKKENRTITLYGKQFG